MWITEQMICRQGVKTRNETGKIKDDTPRSLDQVIHEFGHSIDFKFISDQTLNTFRFQSMTPVESFAWRVQHWFGTPSDSVPENQAAILRNLFTSRALFTCKGYNP